MKLIRVDVREVVVPTHPGRVNSEEYGPAIFDQASKLILEMHTDSGLVGLGETLRGVGEQTIRSACARLAGVDLRTICFQEPPTYDLSADDALAHQHATRPHRLLERSFNDITHLGIHAALLDLLGKQTGLPVSALMGGAYRQTVAVDTWAGRMTPEDSARICRQAKEQGYRGAKFKCALEDDNVDRAVAVAEACGCEFKLTFDPNTRFYRYAEAIGMLRDLAAVGNIGCVEDPFSPYLLEDYRLLRAHGLFPVALHLKYIPMLIDAIRANACDYINLGGTPWDIRRAGDVCWLAGIPTWHSSGVDLGILEALNLHVAAATKSMTRPSDLFGRTVRQHNLITNAMVAKSGAMRVPDAPGLGVELDRHALDQYTVRQFSIEIARQ